MIPAITQFDIQKMEKMTRILINSPFSQVLRIEWITESGGNLVPGWEVYVSEKETKNVSETKGLVTRIPRPIYEQLGREIIDSSPSIIMLKTDINLYNRPNFKIVQIIKREYWSDFGAGTGGIFTASQDPCWTDDQWIGYSLLLPDVRYRILDSGSDSVTVDIGDDEFPDRTITGEIASIVEWYPVYNRPDLGEGALNVIGNSQLFQAVLCTLKPVVGDQG